MDIEEVTQYLGISKNTVYSWVWQRRMPYVKLGRLLRFDEKTINDWMSNHAVEMIAENERGVKCPRVFIDE